MGNTPRTRRTSPLNANSPTTQKVPKASAGIASVADNIPRAIGKSKLGPSFLMSAGARLMVVRPIGGAKPELIKAVQTRSLLSLTAVSGSPTTTTFGSPCPALTSISTGNASTP